MTQTKRRLRHGPAMLLAAVLFSGWPSVATEQNSSLSPPREEAKSAAEFKEFIDRVQAYATLHRRVNSSLPALKPTALPEMITAHQRALARKIREARPNAKPGDIFSEQSRPAFRRAVQDEFQGPHGRGARATIRQGDPLKEVHLRVNESYPDGAPFTTVPPTLLLKFPKLPDEVAYRIVGSDLILLDVDANLVIDSVHGIFPQTI